VDREVKQAFIGKQEIIFLDAINLFLQYFQGMPIVMAIIYLATL
jgi:hypothetical protein